jgi:DNA-directed RNA polymerase subunit alpha
MHIHTNGALNPLDALHYAVSVLRNQLEYFLSAAEIPFSVISTQSKKLDESVKEIGELEESNLQGVPIDLLLKPIEELEFSVRANNCLKNNDIERVIDLVNLSEEDLLGFKNLGRKSLNEVKEGLKTFGLSLGMNVNEAEVVKTLEQQQHSN